MRLRRTILAALAGAVLAAACSELGTDPSGVVALELLPPAMPAVVLGDTLRDTTGAVAPLTAVVLNADGDTISDAPVRFYVLTARDSAALTVDSVTGIVVGDSVVPGTTRIMATVSGLQMMVNLQVTRRPDTVAYVEGRTADTIEYQPGDSTQLSAHPLRVQVAHGRLPAPPGDTTAVLGWLVSYQILYNGAPDTTFAAMVSSGTIRSAVDATEAVAGVAGGVAQRTVLAKQLHLPAGSTTDSVTVRATVKYRGEQVPGSPLDFNVIIRPATTQIR
jgi:hypothetical protein